MIRIADAPLYRKGRLDQKPYNIPLEPAANIDGTQRYRLSASAAKMLGGSGKIYEITPKGIGTVNGFCRAKELLSIQLRLYSGICRVFVSSDELAGLREHFDLPEKIMNTALWEAGNLKRSGRIGALNVLPRWDELLDPEWREAYLSWIKDPSGKPIPKPSAFFWKIFKDTVVFPADMKTLQLSTYDKASELGIFSLRVTDGRPEVLFNYLGRERVYSLFPKISFLGMQGADKTVNYHRDSNIKGLFGVDPSKLELTCVKMPTERGTMGFGNIGGVAFSFTGPYTNRFDPKKEYLLIFKRDHKSLTIYCYGGKDRSFPIGYKILPLEYGGFPMLNSFALEPFIFPEKAISILLSTRAN